MQVLQKHFAFNWINGKSLSRDFSCIFMTNDTVSHIFIAQTRTAKRYQVSSERKVFSTSIQSNSIEIHLLRSTDVPLDRKWKHKWKRASTLNHPLQCPWIISWKIFEYNAKLFSVACRTLYGYVNMMKWYWIQLPPISSSKLTICVCV